MTEEKSIDYCKKLHDGSLKSIRWSKRQLNDNFIKDNMDDINKCILERDDDISLIMDIAVVIPSGLRYEIDDFSNNVSMKNVLEERHLLLSKERTVDDLNNERGKKGGCRYVGLPMKILPNYMNFQYT